MNNDKTTKKGHIKYSTYLKEFLKTFILGNKSDAVLWNAVSRENEESPNSTLKNTFNPNKDRLTINVVQSLLVFVIKKRIDNSSVLHKLNDLFARFCFEDFSKKDKESILDILQKKTLRRFKFYKIDYFELLIFDEKILNEDYNPVQRYKGFDIKLENIVVEVKEIKGKIEYKKIEKESGRNDIKKNIRVYNEIFDEILPVFVGRKFVFNKVDKFISENSKGYFYIKANPGIGKTSLAIKLVEERECFFHIINPQHNGTDNSVKDFISNICSQIIIKYKLPIELFPKDYDLDGDFLYSILRLVSKKNGDNKIVIVIDGLDELKQEELLFFTKETILYLPKTLPQNIFFVITMRKLFQKDIKLITSEINEVFIIEDFGKENVKDVREYIEIVLKDKLIEQYLKKQNISQRKFLKALEEKSEGNFMYLKYIFREILNGSYNDITLTELPQGLDGYYREHWDRMMAVSDEVKDIKLKTIYVLSNMVEPISREFLTNIIKLDINNVSNLQIQDIINDWLQFLNVNFDKKDGRKKYSFYHKSFLDFLASDEIIKAVGADYNQKTKHLMTDYWISIGDKIINNKDGDYEWINTSLFS